VSGITLILNADLALTLLGAKYRPSVICISVALTAGSKVDLPSDREYRLRDRMNGLISRLTLISKYISI
jgi:hypothetical protein